MADRLDWRGRTSTTASREGERCSSCPVPYLHMIPIEKDVAPARAGSLGAPIKRMERVDGLGDQDIVLDLHRPFHVDLTELILEGRHADRSGHSPGIVAVCAARSISRRPCPLCRVDGRQGLGEPRRFGARGAIMASRAKRRITAGNHGLRDVGDRRRGDAGAASRRWGAATSGWRRRKSACCRRGNDAAGLRGWCVSARRRAGWKLAGRQAGAVQSLKQRSSQLVLCRFIWTGSVPELVEGSRGPHAEQNLGGDDCHTGFGRLCLCVGQQQRLSDENARKSARHSPHGASPFRRFARKITDTTHWFPS